MEFWGVEVKPGETVKCGPGSDKYLHLSQASLGETKGKGNENVAVFVKVDDQKLVLGTLSADKFTQIPYDLVFEKEFELSHTSKNASVYFCGYKSVAPDEHSEEDYPESESEEENSPVGQNAHGKPAVKQSQAKSGLEKGNNVKEDASATKKAKKTEPAINDKPKAEDEDDEDDDDEDEDVEDSDSDDEDMLGAMSDSDDEDEDESSEEEDEATPKKVATGKRPAESALKVPASGAEKAAKVITPAGAQKTVPFGNKAEPEGEGAVQGNREVVIVEAAEAEQLKKKAAADQLKLLAEEKKKAQAEQRRKSEEEKKRRAEEEKKKRAEEEKNKAEERRKRVPVQKPRERAGGPERPTSEGSSSWVKKYPAKPAGYPDTLKSAYLSAVAEPVGRDHNANVVEIMKLLMRASLLVIGVQDEADRASSANIRAANSKEVAQRAFQSQQCAIEEHSKVTAELETLRRRREEEIRELRERLVKASEEVTNVTLARSQVEADLQKADEGRKEAEKKLREAEVDLAAAKVTAEEAAKEKEELAKSLTEAETRAAMADQLRQRLSEAEAEGLRKRLAEAEMIAEAVKEKCVAVSADVIRRTKYELVEALKGELGHRPSFRKWKTFDQTLPPPSAQSSEASSQQPKRPGDTTAPPPTQ